MDREVADACRKDLGAFYLRVNPSFAWASFQQEYIVPALHRLANRKIEALALLLPPRHAKSTLATINFTAWLFGRAPTLSNMIVSYNDDFAVEFGARILNMMKSELYREIFPNVHIVRNLQAARRFRLTSGGDFYSAGFSGTLTGRGVSGCLTIDDPLKSMQEARSETVLRTRMEDYESTVKTRLEGAVRLMCLTRWCKGDFFDRVIDSEGTADQGGLWHVLKFPAEAGENDPLARQPGEFLWPEHFPNGVRHYRTLKRNQRTWDALYQQAPAQSAGRFFKLEWIANRYKNPVRPGKFPTYLMCDPARGKERAHDRTAILVIAATPDKRKLLVDGALGRMDPEERSQELVRLVRKWHPRRGVYEELAQSNDTFYISRDFVAAGIRNLLIPIGRKGSRHLVSKESRIEMLIPEFREGAIVLPEQLGVMVDLDDGRRVDLVDYFVEEEYSKYAGDGSVDHDDVLDVLTRIHDDELGIRFPAATAATVESYQQLRARRSFRGGSWESRL